MTTISQENLLGYVKENKLGHDNSQKSNTFLSYYKDNWYGHEFRQGTPPVPPTPTTITVSFDNSSQYLVEPIPSITLSDSNTNTMVVDSTTYSLGIFVDGTRQYTIEPGLVDEWCHLIGWEDDTLNVLTPGVAYTITSDMVLIPMIQYYVVHRDTQGPCPDGFHIGTKSEWQELLTALTTLGAYDVNYIKAYLNIPDAYYLARSSGAKETRYGTVRMWTSTMDSNTVAYAWGIDENNSFVFQSDKPGNGFSIRPFKDNPVVPDSSRTLTYNGIYWNSTLGLISIQNGSDWITISDKNLGATNTGDNGLFYQFGNNSGYTYNASPYRTSKPTISSSYGPGNYYTGSFVRVSSGNNWFNGTNNNLWGGVTNGTWTDPV